MKKEKDSFPFANKSNDSERFVVQSLKLGQLMDEARDYLMGVEPTETTATDIIETTLEKLGYGRNGLRSNFMTD